MVLRKGLTLVVHNKTQRYSLPGKVSDDHKRGATALSSQGWSQSETVSVLSTLRGLILGTRALCIGNFQMLTVIHGTRLPYCSLGSRNPESGNTG